MTTALLIWVVLFGSLGGLAWVSGDPFPRRKRKRRVSLAARGDGYIGGARRES